MPNLRLGANRRHLATIHVLASDVVIGHSIFIPYNFFQLGRVYSLECESRG
jgi:hypothetical protein